MTRRNSGARLPPPTLPMRDGVSPSFVWLPSGSWPSVLAFLRERFPAVSEAVWLARMTRGEVVDQSGRTIQPHAPCRAGTCLFYYREIEDETPIPFEEVILYQDEHLLVADKPHFLPVAPVGRFLHQTLLVRLKKRTGLERLAPIHRLDRETAGVVMFSVDRASRGRYQALFRERRVEKVYEALAPLMPGREFPMTYRSRMAEDEQFFRMREIVGEPNAETHIEHCEPHGELGLYRLRPHSGKTHQLRLHMAALGAPIVNDALYPTALPCKGSDFSRPLQLLARAISFPDPVSGSLHRFESGYRLDPLIFRKS